MQSILRLGIRLLIIGCSVGIGYAQTHAYDQAGRLIKTTHANGQSTASVYDAFLVMICVE